METAMRVLEKRHTDLPSILHMHPHGPARTEMLRAKRILNPSSGIFPGRHGPCNIFSQRQIGQPRLNAKHGGSLSCPP